MFAKTKSLLIKLYQLLTLFEMSFVWWLFIVFFWLLGFASPSSFNIATVLALLYYYLGLLPAIGQFLSSSYGQLFHNRQDLKLLPYLLVLSISLLTLPGIAHYYKLSYINAFGAAIAIHLVLHAIWLRAASYVTQTLKLIITWLLILNPFLDNTLSQVKSAWLYIPQSRNALFGFLERQLLTQLMLLSLPLLLLLYCWQPSNPYFLLNALILLSVALLSTYWPLCYPQSLGTIVMGLMMMIIMGPETLLLASPTIQLYLIGSMLLITIVLRYSG